jgi:hypothetical protein
MDKELDSLIIKYKTCLDQLTEINHKVEKVNLSEQVIANHLKKDDNVTIATGDEQQPAESEKLNQILYKLKIDVDTALQRRITDVNTSKQDVQLYIDNILWNLFSRTELQANKFLFNNDPNRRLDKNCLMKMITTLINIDNKQEQQLMIKSRYYNY